MCREVINVKVYELPRNFGLGGNGLSAADQAKLDNITVTQPVNLDSLGNPLAYTESFLLGDWTNGQLTVLESVHGKGDNPIVTVYDSSGNEVVTDVTRSPSGDITLTVTFGSGFDGELTIN